jgi:aquaporin Z
MNADIRKYLAEFLGTFGLVFIGTAVATLQGGLLSGGTNYGPPGLLMVSFAFGGTLMCMVLVIGPVSGCHINPAVTLPMALSGRLPWRLVPGYVIAQFAGGLAASAVLLALLKGFAGKLANSPLYEVSKHGLGANGNPMGMEAGSLFGWELLITALFLFTIFAATRGDGPAGFHALAIGGFLFIAHLVGAQLGDSSLNPARSFGPAIVSGQGTDVLWIFLVGPMIGGLLGWAVYKVIYAD